ncbi:MAG: nuclear transport factor 2 family protein [Myxococcota bacterium]
MDELPIDRCTRYFRAFAARDLEALGELLAPGVELRDWEIRARGRDAVLRANEGIFDAVEKIDLKVLDWASRDRCVFAELEIEFDRSGAPLRVVDVIELDEEGRIVRVRAYKG